MKDSKYNEILIVDDSPDHLEILNRLLTSHHYKVRIAREGEQALKSIETSPPHLILIDVIMPKMDGFEVCRRLKAHPKHQTIPIIFMSVLHETLNKVKAFQVGGVDYITKPFQKDVVLARIHTHLSIVNYQNQLKESQNMLLDQAYQQGMAQTATDVLHNIGNMLNSVSQITYDIQSKLKKPIKNKWLKANEILKDNLDNLEQFILDGAKGKQLLQYYLALEEPFEAEHAHIKENFQQLLNNVESINKIIISQLQFARGPHFEEQLYLQDLLRETLKMKEVSFNKHGIQLETYLENVEKIKGNRTKLIHVLVNLLTNAKDSLKESNRTEPKIKLELRQINHSIQLDISDNGQGILEENLVKIFNYGFTTKSEGFGFGLHSCANYLQEMGGSIQVMSAGKDQGATFRLLFPVVA